MTLRGWCKMQTKNIFEICNPKQWKTLSTNDLYESGYPVYGAGGVIGYWKNYNHEKETLIIGCRGSCGNLIITERQSYINGNAMALDDLNTSLVDIKYLYYYLSYRGLDDTVTGGVQKQITRTSLKNVFVTIPSLETQKKIVEVLDKAQGLIDARKEQISLMDELIQSVFYEMFGDPVTNPKGWEISKLKNHVINIESGWSPKCLNNDASINKWGVLKLSAVTGGQYKEEHNKELPEGILPKLGLEIKDGDLLLTRKNTPELVGDSCFVFRTREKLMMPDIIFRIQTKQTLNRLFLWAVFNTNGLKSRIKSLASGSAKSMSNISKAKLYDLEVVVPSIELQNDFENQVREVVEYKELLLQSLLELETYNKALFRESFESN